MLQEKPELQAENQQPEPEPAEFVRRLASNFEANWSALTYPFSREGRAARQTAREIRSGLEIQQSQTAARALSDTEQRIQQAVEILTQGGSTRGFSPEEIHAAESYLLRARQQKESEALTRMHDAAQQEQLLRERRGMMAVMGESIDLGSQPESREDQIDIRVHDEDEVRKKFNSSLTTRVGDDPYEIDPFGGRQLGSLDVGRQLPQRREQPADDGDFNLSIDRFWLIEGLLANAAPAKLLTEGKMTQAEWAGYMADYAKRHPNQ